MTHLARGAVILAISFLALGAASIAFPDYDYKTGRDAGMKLWSPSGFSFVSRDASVTFAPGGPISCSSGTCVTGGSIESLPMNKVTGVPLCAGGEALRNNDAGLACIARVNVATAADNATVAAASYWAYKAENLKGGPDAGMVPQNNESAHWNGDAGWWEPTQGMIYGELFDYESATPLTLTLQSTYYQLTDTNIGYCSGMTCSVDTDDITATVAGTYQVNATMGFTLDANTQIIEFQVFKEGTGQTNCSISRKIGTGADQGAASITCMVEMAVGDSLTLRAADMDGAGNSLSVQHMNLNAHLVK